MTDLSILFRSPESFRDCETDLRLRDQRGRRAFGVPALAGLDARGSRLKAGHRTPKQKTFTPVKTANEGIQRIHPALAGRSGLILLLTEKRSKGRSVKCEVR